MTVIEFIVGSAGSMIKQQLVDEAVFLWGVRGQFEWIERELSRISRYLKDADAKAREGNDSIKGWVVDVMGIAYDADDAITFFVWMEEQRQRRTLVGKCLFFCCDLLNLHKAGIMIEAVKKNIEEISTSRSNFPLKEIREGEGHEASSSSLSRLQQYRNAITDFEEDLFVGFDHDMAALRDNLTKGVLRRCVVSIVAMGGAGKTTLARKLYNDSDVKAHFGSNVAWVCVSQTYIIKELLQGIAEQVMGLRREDSGKLTDSQLREKLGGFLRIRRYLVVVDDIWNKEAWDLLGGAFPDGNKGSRVLLTTRNMDVALYADRRSSPHQLRLLTEEESWALFLNIVFPPMEENGEPSCPGQLKDVARQTVAKCGGLPLAIRVLGGLSFTTSHDANEWRKVLHHHLKWQLSHEPEHFHDILALSYIDLPDYLKPCFLYLGIFPEDYTINKERLTMLWIAEGLMQGREKSSMEDVAEQCFGELAKRNMIQVIREGFACRVHDMLRDLAIKEAKRVELFEIDDDPQLFKDASTSTSALTRVRRLGIHHSSNEDRNRVWPVKSGIPPKVRSLLCFISREYEGFQPQGLGRAKCLRVLHLGKVSEDIEGHVIGELVHLKYLQVKGLDSLPSSIGKLYNLQTLDLSYSITQLPQAIWRLHRLRHLLARGAFFDGRPQLDFLQHLHTLELKADEWIEEKSLTKLSKLRTLRIYQYFNKFGEALIKAIQGMVHLQRFQLYGCLMSSLPPFKPFNDNSQLEVIILGRVRILQEGPQVSLEFPPMLTRLELSETELKDDPMSTLGKLKNLRFLSFGTLAFIGSQLCMPEQGFPQLKRFELMELPNLDEWIVEEGAMPTIKHLTIERCNKLKKLPKGLQNITTLKGLTILFMPTEFRQRLTKNGGKDWRKIQHIPSVEIF